MCSIKENTTSHPSKTPKTSKLRDKNVTPKWICLINIFACVGCATLFAHHQPVPIQQMISLYYPCKDTAMFSIPWCCFMCFQMLQQYNGDFPCMFFCWFWSLLAPHTEIWTSLIRRSPACVDMQIVDLPGAIGWVGNIDPSNPTDMVVENMVWYGFGCYSLVICYIAIGKGHRNFVRFPTEKNVIFSIAVLNYQRIGGYSWECHGEYRRFGKLDYQLENSSLPPHFP